MKQKENTVMMEFHISRKVRDLHQFDDPLSTPSGNVIFLNFHAARLFAQRMNEKRDLINFPEQATFLGRIFAGEIRIEGSLQKFVELMSCMDGFEFWFNIVTP